MDTLERTVWSLWMSSSKSTFPREAAVTLSCQVKVNTQQKTTLYKVSGLTWGPKSLRAENQQEDMHRGAGCQEIAYLGSSPDSAMNDFKTFVTAC